MGMDPNAKKKLDDEQMIGSNHKQQISESQYLDLVTMINALGDEMKSLQRTVSESMNVSRRSSHHVNNENEDVNQEYERKKKRRSKKQRTSSRSSKFRPDPQLQS